MNKTEIKTYFNQLASTWDDHMILDDPTTNLILDSALIKPNESVLDVATGTGVLIPFYLARHNTITGIDMSEEMIHIAQTKFPHVPFLCEDIDTYSPEETYDHIMIYNSFPHFTDPEKTISHLCELVKEGGTITIAHNMSYEKLKKHHEGGARHVTNTIMTQEKMNALLQKNDLEVLTSIFDDNKIITVGRKK